jgi:hypothetical protein
MFKDIIRMILPLVVLVLIALCLALSPVLGTHAAAPHGAGMHVAASHNLASSQQVQPHMRWKP